MLQKEITRKELIEQHKIEEQKEIVNKKFSELYEKYFEKKV